jgi:hypothetical protein
MRQKNGFDRFPEFKSKGIEFEVGDKYISVPAVNWPLDPSELSGLFIKTPCKTL